MPAIGLRYPVYAALTENEETKTFTYGAGAVVGKAVQVDVNINISNVPFYADDALAEQSREFVDGTITFRADDLPETARSVWLGNQIATEMVGTESVQVLQSNVDDTPGFFGFGFILPIVKNKQKMYRAIIFTKVQFREPNLAAETKGQQVNWQTPVIEGTIMRRVDGNWKKEITVASLDTAKAWLAQELSIT